jgi:hypothetical protein
MKFSQRWLAFLLAGSLMLVGVASRAAGPAPNDVSRRGAPPRAIEVISPRVDALPVSVDSSAITGVPWVGDVAAAETTAQIMDQERRCIDSGYTEENEATEVGMDPKRPFNPVNPLSPDYSSWPPEAPMEALTGGSPFAPQTLGTSFTGATLSGTNPTNAFPPDSMGAVGPTQYIVAVNNRIVTFSKTSGAADGVLNATTNTFFNSVRNSSGTSDPRIRYDRLSGRWFVVIINVSTPNRILIAVSDAASAGIISGSTVWTFFYIPIDSTPPAISNTCLADYPSLGVDANALYIGTDNFCGSPTQTFNSTDGYVVRKSSILGSGPVVVTVFRGLVPNTTSSGPWAPQGVDNFDAGATEGYFIGVDSLSYGLIDIRRVTDPGGTPSISGNIALTVNATNQALTVPHLGNTGGTNGQLDPLDDRLFAACIRNGRLWTAHNIKVNSSGTTSGTPDRDATRWYEIQNLQSPGTPSVVQSGTVFDTAASNPLFFWIPSVMVSGQGHAALGFSSAGASAYVNAATLGRLAGDPLGTTQGAPINYTSSSTAYNPPSDTGASRGSRRWGDYSYTSLDPCDDMTMWTVQEFCDATNSYGVRIVKLIAPPPATPASASPATVAAGQPSVNVVITGTTSSGSGFYDPGAGFACRIAGAVTGGVVVNSVTYTDSTHVTLNLSTLTASLGAQNVTITNPDGQSATGNGILTITAACAANPTAVDVTPNGPMTLCSGASQTLTATPTGGTGPLTYQWTRDGSTIVGATASSYAAADSGSHSYNCTVKGSGCGTGMQDSSPTSVTWVSAPTFAGLTGVANPSNSTCTLNLAWSAATANCGGPIYYNVYRSTSTPFTPDPTPGTGNRIATGVVGTSFADIAGLVSGTAYYYIVRAVDVSNGAEDTNAVTLSGMPFGPGTSTQTLFSQDFETGSGTNGWEIGTFNSGSTADWRGIQACTAHSGTHIYRFGGSANCTANYANNDYCFAAPGGATGVTVPAVASQGRLSFWHEWQFQSGIDGALLYISTDNSNFTYVPAAAFISGGYNSAIGTTAVWSGTSTGYSTTFEQVVVDIDAAANAIPGNTGGASGKTIWIAFTGYSNNNTVADGWFLDDVSITVQVPASCVSGIAPGSVKPVPDGMWVGGTAMKGSKLATDGSSVQITWDKTTCTDANYNIYYGNGTTLASYPLSGSQCGIGTSGSYAWAAPAIPGGQTFIWWVLVGTDGASMESSWGRDSAGTERHPAASNQCGYTAKSTATTCP